MKKVECRKCGCDIFTEYGDNVIEELNTSNWFSKLFKNKHKPKKYFSELNLSPSETCNTTIYLTCEYNHTEKYFCKIETNN